MTKAVFSRKPLFVFPPTPGCAFHPTRDAADSAPRRMQPVLRNPFAPGGHFWRHIPTRPASGSLRQRTGPFRLPPATPAAHARHLRHIGHPAQTGHSAPRRPEVPFHSDRTFRLAQTEYSTRCRQAMLRTAGHSLRRGRHKKTGTAAHSLRKGQAQKNGTAAHTRPRKGNRIS